MVAAIGMAWVISGARILTFPNMCMNGQRKTTIGTIGRKRRKTIDEHKKINKLLFSCIPFRVPPSENFRKHSSLVQVVETLFDEVWLLRVDCPECFQKVTYLGWG